MNEKKIKTSLELGTVGKDIIITAPSLLRCLERWEKYDISPLERIKEILSNFQNHQQGLPHAGGVRKSRRIEDKDRNQN